MGLAAEGSVVLQERRLQGVDVGRETAGAEGGAAVEASQVEVVAALLAGGEGGWEALRGGIKALAVALSGGQGALRSTVVG